MKNKILVYIIIIFAVLCGLTHNVYSQSDVTYFYGEILNLQWNRSIVKRSKY